MKMKLSKKILGLMFVFMFIINIGTVFADETKNVKEVTQQVREGASILKDGFNTVVSTIGKVVGGPPWMHGLIAGGFTALNTYNSLGQEVKIQLERNKVNISYNKDDYFSELDYEDLNINFDPNSNTRDIVLTDKNVLDLTYLETTELSEYYNEKSPDVRVAELTQDVSLKDSNNSYIDGQLRSVLFEDKEETISDSFEFRNLLIRYGIINYKEDPIKVTVGMGSFWDNFLGSNGGLFTTGVNTVLKRITNKMDSDVNNKKNPLTVTQRFHLLFNSRSEDTSTISLDQLDCTTADGSILGTTGSEYLPNVVLDWDFEEGDVQKINDPEVKLSRKYWCDSEKNGVYCDSTQFAIEVLLKIKEINDLVSKHNNSFNCPPAYREQDLVTNLNNVGLTYIEANFDNDENPTQIDLDYSIGGNYDLNTSTNITNQNLFSLKVIARNKSPNSFEWRDFYTNTKDVSGAYLLSGEPNIFNESISLREVGSNDQIKISISLESFSENIIEYEESQGISDNTIELELNNGPAGCIIEKTSLNLKNYVTGTNNAGVFDDLIEFKANLMLDGYGSDFQKDFDDLYRLEFANNHEFYTSEQVPYYTPMYKYFANTNNFKFLTRTSDPTRDLVLPGPGRYEVQIKIIYDNNWKLFNDAGEPTGKIEIILNKDMKPEIDMPIYYMPIDGVTGIVDKTRINYGSSYLGDSVNIDTEMIGSYNLKTQGYTSSNALKTIEVEEIKDFGVMNNTQRGELLSITSDSAHNNNKIRFIPSRATPVALRISNSNKDAYAFYKLSIGAPEGEGGQIAHPGYSLTNWTSYNNCEDFTGISSIEAYLGRPDIVATESEFAPISQSQNFAYGVEWGKDQITRSGNMWLKTIFYTPTNYKTGTGISRLYMESYSDEAYLYTVDELDGQKDVKLTSLDMLEDKVESIKEIYDMIAQKNACVNYESTYFDVFYNPKKVYDKLDEEVNSLVYETDDTKCIGLK